MTSLKRSGATTEHLSRRQLAREPARLIARGTPIFAESGSTIGEAISLMQAHGGDSLLVRAGGRLVGVLTERDILQRVLGRGVDPQALVDGFMTPDPQTVGSDATLLEVLRLMDRGGFRSVPIVGADGRVEAIVRQSDVLAFVAEAFPQEILNLPPRPDQVAVMPEGG
jgi:CBS domain-containing protein